MKYTVTQSRGIPDDWRVTSTEEREKGRVELAIFSGPRAQDRAHEYAAWKNQDAEERTQTEYEG